jgi:hypothetical protein
MMDLMVGIKVSNTRELSEKGEPDNSSRIWITRDQIAYWEGLSEGLKFVLDQLEK